MVLSYFQFPGIPNVHCAFQGRSGPGQEGNISYQTGDDPQKVLENRRELASRLGQGFSSWSECRQIHGDALLYDPVPTPMNCLPSKLSCADGMATGTAGQGLLIKTADCQPILIAHNSGRFVMALHVGWRGNRINFPGMAIKKFCAFYSLQADELFAVRGPSLGPAMAQFINFDREWGPEFLPWFNEDSQCVNLWLLSRHQLENAGVPPGHIYELDICTALNKDAYFSYRADKQCGRQASIIWMAA